jgi:hypothetical protein
MIAENTQYNINYIQQNNYNINIVNVITDPQQPLPNFVFQSPKAPLPNPSVPSPLPGLNQSTLPSATSTTIAPVVEDNPQEVASAFVPYFLEHLLTKRNEMHKFFVSIFVFISSDDIQLEDALLEIQGEVIRGKQQINNRLIVCATLYNII